MRCRNCGVTFQTYSVGPRAPILEIRDSQLCSTCYTQQNKLVTDKVREPTSNSMNEETSELEGLVSKMEGLMKRPPWTNSEPKVLDIYGGDERQQKPRKRKPQIKKVNIKSLIKPKPAPRAPFGGIGIRVLE